MEQVRPICRKCLLAEMDEDSYIRTLKEYIAAYPEDKRVGDEEYKRRLSVCTRCERLANGMCELCGCYVELRALKTGAYCPDSFDKWTKE